MELVHCVRSPSIIERRGENCNEEGQHVWTACVNTEDTHCSWLRTKFSSQFVVGANGEELSIVSLVGAIADFCMNDENERMGSSALLQRVFGEGFVVDMKGDATLRMPPPEMQQGQQLQQ